MMTSIESFRNCIQSIETGDHSEDGGQTGWMYDSARLNLALSHFRVFEQRHLPIEQRKAAIQEAIASARSVHDRHTNSSFNVRALNDILYYVWEERSAWPDSALWSVSDRELEQLVATLAKLDKEDPARSYERYDTLTRLYDWLGDRAKAHHFARKVCDLLGTAASRRSGGHPEPIGGRPSYRWISWIVRYLRNPDETDALAFALHVIEDLPDVGLPP